MSKKISKLLLALLLIIITISSFSICFATTEAITTSETEGEAVVTSEEGTTTLAEKTTDDKIHYGDLYLFDTDILMDKIVYGNVFIFGTNVQITGKIDGDLFVFANTVTFGPTLEETNNNITSNCEISSNIFACANSVYFNGACNQLYVATNNLEMTYNSLVVRDVKAVSSNVIFKAAVGRDVDLLCNDVNFGEGEDIPIIYGNLRYSANNESSIPKDVLAPDSTGTITYTKLSELENNSASTVKDILIGFITCIVTVLVTYAIGRKYTSNFAEKLSNKKLSALKLLKFFGIGLASIFIVAVSFVLLLATTVGINLVFILLLLYIVLCLIAVPVLTIVISNILKPAFKIEKTSMFCLILILVSIVLHGITLIPIVGGFLGFIIKMIAIGLLIDIYLPHKELTDEEKIAIEAAKKQSRENKEKRKNKKLKIKENKIQKKSKTKDSKISKDKQ